ncbi:MAG: tRNA (adenosine(37)-N6)-dimethylallyltransferase MiaA [Candidatus Absconditabacteria bacterium]|nr:tRNA (adenosine(37)-N6)-dimethylallyltransferase MiaA [Candidatus Absconditabacteria bacterium]MDD3868021.1 tRNA (adenosine(37)-N6)-dimethylallyltransferase MiaA [Candidatus Absconditabacteria bacterium]MDD4714268.1 tRNA (adenosine(37)-N6)-dimethylallyltransferase MiaA [Candidatus Absconditabacteria bacterium]
MDFQDILPEAQKICEEFLMKYADGTIIIRGATATGKSKLSVLLSDFFDTEIISADSRQIFRKMDIGTDKIPAEIRAKIPHHQIDIVNPEDSYTAGQRKDGTERAIEGILQRNRIPIVVGGTGLYIDTIYKNFSMPECPPNPELREQLQAKEDEKAGYLYEELMKIDPEEAQKLHPNSHRYLIRALEIFHGTGMTKTENFQQQKVIHPLLMLGLWREKEETNKRINARIKEMLKGGLIEEVQGLLDEGYSKDLQSMQGIGYKEVVGYLERNYDQEKMEEELRRNTHYLAKKQRTWFRRYIAEGIQAPRENVEYKVWNLG